MLPSLFQLTGIPKSIFDIATSANPGEWLSFGIGLLLSTIVSGLLFVLVLYFVGKEWHEGTNPAYAFLVVFIINAVSRLGVIQSLLSPLGYLGINLGFLLLWILLSKLFFREMEMKHAAILGALGFVANYIAIVYVLPSFQAFIRL